ncbi:MAG: hypothetical protein BIFFINMI_00200 [Phycisphaerae bacterium]|nr:hypothetical protein [Phycisphaerae bacterium]
MILLYSLAWFAVGLVSLTALVWLVRHREVSLAVREDPPLRPGDYRPAAECDTADWPMISVLVAAKDEQAVIEKCLRTVLDQDYPNFEVICINDRSGDDTGRIADSIAAADQRLRVVHVTELADGWFGKNNAMRLGVEAARGDWFCFIDADCTQVSRQSLSLAYQHAREHGSPFLSVLPQLVADGFWEQVLQPVCGGIMVFWFRPKRVNNPKSRAAYANGAFMLMDKKAYWQIGGHEPVKAEVNEDIHMARLAKADGIRLRVVQNQGLYTTHMYHGFKATWRGWTRIFYGSFVSRGRLFASLAMMVLMGVFPYLSFIGGLIAVLAGATGPLAWGFLIAGGASAFFQQTVLLRFYPLTGIPTRYVVTYILAAFICTAIIINAIRKVGGRSAVTWRGTTYKGKQRVG